MARCIPRSHIKTRLAGFPELTTNRAFGTCSFSQPFRQQVWHREHRSTRRCSSPHKPHLTILLLSENNIGNEGAEVIASSPHLQNLNTLHLSNNRIGAEGTKALTHSANLQNLTSLDLSLNGIRAEGTKAIAESPDLKNLTSLDLD